MNFRLAPAFALGLAMILSACGGGGTSFDTEPLAAAGFASEENQFSGDYDFTIPNATRLVGDGEGNVSLVKKGPIRIVGTNRVGPVEVTLDGKTYTLQRAPNNAGPIEFDDGEDWVRLYPSVAGNEFVELTSLFAIIDGKLDSAFLARGYDTDPAAIARMSGSASYNGEAHIDVRSGYFDAFGRGDASFTVNFEDNTIEGEALLVNTFAEEFYFAPVSIVFERTSIDENGFTGDVSVTSPIDGTLVDATYDGRFFGSDAEAVAGEFVGRLDGAGQGDNADTHILGGFLAEK